MTANDPLAALRARNPDARTLDDVLTIASRALITLAEIEGALRDAVNRDPDHWNEFHTSRLAGARGRASRLLEQHNVQITEGKEIPHDRHS
jgi:hypothetical protein